MRVLHTSDWHIGRTFHGVDLLADQVAVVEAIVGLVTDLSVDVVALPGDVYDRSVPGSDAVLACNHAFEAIRAAGAVIVVTSGNHDSPVRLGAGAAFAAAGGLHLMTTMTAVDRPILLSDEHGPLACYGIPYADPDVARMELDAPRARSHADILEQACCRIRADATRRGAPRTLVLAHAFVTGAEVSGSERSISVGGVETVPASVFDGIDYVALGHLHSPQKVSEFVRYSGSPLPYSFGERTHRKAVWLVEYGPAGVADVQRHELPIVRGLSQLSGTMDELLTSRAHTDAENDYVSVVLTDTVRPLDAMRRLQARFPYAVHVEWQRPQGNPDLIYRDRVRGRSDIDIVRNFLTDVHREPTSDELAWVRTALELSR